jgi:putative DNA primase/helicase
MTAAGFDLTGAALTLAARGVPVLALRGNKRPCATGSFKGASTDPETVRRAFADPTAVLIGFATGAASQTDILDIDPKAGGDLWLAANEYRLPATRRYKTRSGGVHILFRHAPGMGCSASRVAPGVDVRGDLGYAVAWDMHGFRADGDALAEWPAWLHIEAIRRLDPNAPLPAAEDLAPPDVGTLLALLAAMPNPDFATRDDYTAVNLAVQGCIRGLEALGRLDDPAAVYEAAADWCSRWDSQNASTYETELTRWRDDWSTRDRDISGYRHLLGLAAKLGADVAPFVLAGAAADFGALPDEPTPAGFRSGTDSAGKASPNPKIYSPVLVEPSVNEATESAVAAGFGKDMQNRILFDHTAGAWVLWDVAGGVWRRDETGRGFAAIAEYVRQVRALFGGTDKSMAGVAFVGAVDRFARTDQRLAVSAAAWDVDPWVLGVPGGVVDLRTGELRPADPALRLSKQSTVAPAAPGTVPPLWRSFLASATGGDSAYEAYLQRWAGYCLTGSTREEAFGFGYGRGGTGKTVFASSIEAVMGAYAAPMPADALSTRARSNPEYALAALAGIRLTIASEVERGAPLAEAFVKLATGGENSIPARQPYGKPFNYRPQFKMLVLANHLPTLSDRSSAMERRTKILPFDIVPANPDPTLKERLRAEYPAILRWMIDGCLAWQRDGLGTCKAVETASGAYFDDQDAIGVWAAERLAFATGLQAKRADLLSDFNLWARANGERPMYAQQFCETARRSLKLTDKTIRGVRMLAGADLKHAEDFANVDELVRMMG